MDYPQLHIFLNPGVDCPSIENLKKWSGSQQIITPEVATNEQSAISKSIGNVLSEVSHKWMYGCAALAIQCSEMPLMLYMSISSDINEFAWLTSEEDRECLDSLSGDLEASADFYSRISDVSDDHHGIAYRIDERRERCGLEPLELYTEGYEMVLSSINDISSKLNAEALSLLQVGDFKPVYRASNNVGME